MSKKDRIPSLKSLMEADESKFGDEISKINDWFSKEYDESYQFKWDGKSLKVLDSDEKEVTTISRADLAKKIEGFPEKANEEEELDDDGKPKKPEDEDEDEDEDEIDDEIDDEAEKFIKENKLPKNRKELKETIINFYTTTRKSIKKK